MTDENGAPDSVGDEVFVELARLSGLSDAVFAIALTLLVLEIRLPEDALASDLPGAILRLAPRALVYLVGFVVIGGAWGSHQRMLGQIKRGDGPLVWLTLLSLLFVTLVPACAALLGRFPREWAAVSCFAVDALLVQLAAMWLWRHASRHGLVDPSLNFRVISGIGRRLGISAAVFAVSIPAALINPSASYALWIAIYALLFTTDWLSWQQANRTEGAFIPLDAATEARIRVQHAGGLPAIAETDSVSNLIQGTFGGGLDTRVSRSGQVVNVDLVMRDRRGLVSRRYPWAWGPSKRLDWTIGLHIGIPIALQIDIAGGQAQLDLGHLLIGRLIIRRSFAKHPRRGDPPGVRVWEGPLVCQASG